ncbi:MAG: 50S ribosomal protein L2 [Candidatus Campbellbacteria bacterium]|nr:50S ribosomal protein L2 [Candidatus Campbellbacteria bacterium]
MKSYKPTSPARRHMTVVSTGKVLSGAKPAKKLTKGYKRSVGRNHQGRLTSRHKGGGHKRKTREIDWIFDKHDIPAKIESLEYDPNRSGFIALVVYADGEKRYILAPKNVKVGQDLVVSKDAPIKAGNRTMLSRMPVGTFVYNIEIKPNQGGKLVRSAGNYAEVIAVEGDYVSLKMPSTEVRKVLGRNFATVGEVSNPEHRLRTVGKAGRSRHMGVRPTVRGSAMNAVDHPYGGGEGRAGRGMRRAKSKWGKPTGLGQKTRTPKKYSDRLIINKRKSKRRSK